MAEAVDLPFGLWGRVGRRKHQFNHICRVVPICTISIIFTRWRQSTQQHSAVSCAKQLNQSICCLGCRLNRAKGSTSSTIFVRWCQCAQMGGHIGATWRIRIPSAAVMWSYVKLLWPLIIIIIMHNTVTTKRIRPEKNISLNNGCQRKLQKSFMNIKWLHNNEQTSSESNTSYEKSYYFTASMDVKYCDKRVRMSVCLSTCISQIPHIQTSQNFLYVLIVVVA